MSCVFLDVMTCAFLMSRVVFCFDVMVGVCIDACLAGDGGECGAVVCSTGAILLGDGPAHTLDMAASPPVLYF